MLAVGEPVLGEVSDSLLRATTGLGGGTGLTYHELCGAFTSGVLIIGAHCGRTHPAVDDAPCQQLVRRFRSRFRKHFDTLDCHVLREEKFGSGGQAPCSVLIEQAALILLDVLAGSSV